MTKRTVSADTAAVCALLPANAGGQAFAIASVVATCLLVCPPDALAQGLTGGLRGLREAFFMLWGALGILPGLMLLGAFGVSRREGRRKTSAVLLSLPAVLYTPAAIGLMFVESNDLAAKLPGSVGFGLLIALFSFWFAEKQGLRRSLQATAAALLVVLVLTPNSFWRVRLLSFEKKTFVDNLDSLGALESVRTTSVPNEWIELGDGRRLLQVRDEGAAKGAPTYFPYGERVVLEHVPSGDANEFDITFYRKTAEYRKSLVSPPARVVLPLTESTLDRYEEVATARALLLDENAGVDYTNLLLSAIRHRTGWNVGSKTEDQTIWQGWVLAFIDLGDIDIDSPEFLDRLFRTDKDHTGIRVLVDMGMDPVAVDSRGNTVLHIAAGRNDLSLFRRLLELDVDPELRNFAGRTALDVLRMHYRQTPDSAYLAGIERLLEERRTTSVGR